MQNGHSRRFSSLMCRRVDVFGALKWKRWKPIEARNDGVREATGSWIYVSSFDRESCLAKPAAIGWGPYVPQMGNILDDFSGPIVKFVPRGLRSDCRLKHFSLF